jgi:hypothetical protein
MSTASKPATAAFALVTGASSGWEVTIEEVPADLGSTQGDCVKKMREHHAAREMKVGPRSSYFTFLDRGGRPRPPTKSDFCRALSPSPGTSLSTGHGVHGGASQLN